MPYRSPAFLRRVFHRFVKHRAQVLQIQTLLTTKGLLQYGLSASFFSKKESTILFNVLLESHLGSKQAFQRSVYLFTLMLATQIQPDRYTFPPLFKAAKLSFSCTGISFHCQSLRRGVLSDPFVQTSLLSFYSHGYELVNARKVFDEILTPSTVECNAMLDAFARNGDMKSSVWLFSRMIDRDVVSWTTLINGFALIGFHQEAIEVFREMIRRESSIAPSEATMVCVLSSCSKLEGGKGFSPGKQIHCHLIKWDTHTVFLGTSLIDFYGKMGSSDYADKIFRNMKKKEACTWNAMINSLANNGHEKQALETFSMMKQRGIIPNSVTFVSLLSACARTKHARLGFDLFRFMLVEFNLFPVTEHYGCLVDLLGQVGLVSEACEIVKSMPFEPDVSVLNGLLNACKVNGEMICGGEVGERISRLQPQSCGKYVALATISCELERWDFAAEIRRSMVVAGIQKVPACSWIDL